MSDKMRLILESLSRELHKRSGLPDVLYGIEFKPTPPLKTKDGMVCEKMDEAIESLDMYSRVDQSNIVYAKKVINTRKLFECFARERALNMGRELFFLENYLLRYPEGNHSEIDKFFILATVDVASLDPHEIIRGITDMEESRQRGYLFTRPSLDWLRLVTSHERSAGVLVFENLNTASIDCQIKLKGLLESGYRRLKEWKVKGDWSIHASGTWPNTNHFLDTGVNSRLGRFYLDES
jgi:hypothetical protein